MLNIVDNYQQCGQGNIALACYYQPLRKVVDLTAYREDSRSDKLQFAMDKVRLV